MFKSSITLCTYTYYTITLEFKSLLFISVGFILFMWDSTWHQSFQREEIHFYDLITGKPNTLSTSFAQFVSSLTAPTD